MERIPLDECKDRLLYRIQSRNLSFGVFTQATGGFIGIREKFQERFLFTEYHYDTGAPFGTVHPQEELEPLPEVIILEEIVGTLDKSSRRAVALDKPRSQGGRGWYFIDTNEYSDRIIPVAVQNAVLFSWLSEKEKQYTK